MNRRAATMVCYICGREFGSRSLGIHEPQCLKKWHNQNDQLPKEQRRPAPQKPTMILPNVNGSIDTQRLNEAAWAASQANLAPCHNCGRTFNPDRLAVHQKSCRPGKPLKPLNTSARGNAGASGGFGGGGGGGEGRVGGAGGAGGGGGPPGNKRPLTATLDNPKVVQHKTSRIDVGDSPMLRSSRPRSSAEGYQTPTSGYKTPTPSGYRTPTSARALPPKTPQNRARPKTVTLSSKRPPPVSSNPYGPPTPMKKPARRRPQFVVCYICGREFTSASLPIHEPQCLDKWKMENNRLPRELRRPVPKKPQVVPVTGSGSYNLDAANLAAMEAATANLVPCRNCGRKFVQDRIQVHERICKKTGVVPRAKTFHVGDSVGANNNNNDGNNTNQNYNPCNPVMKEPPKREHKFVFCYICGRQFITASLKIHEPQCLKKWEMENARLPPNMRRPAPKKPEPEKPIGGGGGYR
jgi:hypothetical protein